MNNGAQLTLMMGDVIATALPREVTDALVSVDATNSAGKTSGFQLVFAVSKNSTLMTTLLPSGFFDPMRRVIITVTVNGMTEVIMDGVITKQDMAPSDNPAESTLTITGVDVSQVMDLIDFTGFPWPAMPAEARVAIMVAKYAPYGIIPMVIPSVLLVVPNPLESIPPQKGTDLQYVKKLADDAGYVFYIEPGPVAGTNTAYWGPEIKVGAVQPALSVNMDAHTNVESLSFSFDGMAKTLFVFMIHSKELKIPIPIPVPDITPLNPPLGSKYPIPFNIKNLSNAASEDEDDSTAKYGPIQAAARGLARASQASDVISGSGTLDVARYGRVLKARQLVGVRGAGVMYDGHYFVKSVTHKIARGEYKQSFKLTRNAHVSLTSEVAV
jgi:hypothetical protein